MNGSSRSPGNNNKCGRGGSGLSSSITGSSVARAGGGSGGTSDGSGFGVVTSVDGGGSGGSTSTPATAGAVNKGAGGGGGGNFTGVPGSGGSGFVALRYADTYPLATSTTGSPTITTSGGFRIYQWTGSGSITF